MDTTVARYIEGPQKPPKLKFKYPQNSFNIIIAQQSLPPLNHEYFYPVVDVSRRFEQSLEKCRKRQQKQRIKIKAIEKTTISKQLSDNIIEKYRKNGSAQNIRSRCISESTDTNNSISLKSRRASELVDKLLLEIYGRTSFGQGSTERIFDTEYGSSTSFKSITDKFDEKLQYGRLVLKDVTELRILIGALRERVTYAGNLLVKQLKKRDALKSKQEKICNVITAHLHAYSNKRSEDTNMRFTPNPIPGDSGFNQWRDAMKMVAKLPGGIPPEFRKKLWIALAEKHLQSKGVNWSQTEKLCFNEWSNPDDSELGIQIVKDLHRTGCSLFCGTAGQENQALLKRVLLAYARWNKSVGYCQGFNMLAALILQVMDKNETDSVKVMIYLIEGVLPESYFANNLRGLSVDMIVFRDLLKMRLPQLSKHLEALQNDAREGNSYEPPLTNVFTMQWFLTLFCNCLPQPTVLRVWDLIFLEGNEILLRTAIAIWSRLSDRILAVNSADEFYSIMGVLTREMLEFGLVDSNTLIKSIVAIGPCSELDEMRDKYLYNITPWTQSVQTAAKKGFKLFYSDDDDVESDYDERAAVTAAYGISLGRRASEKPQSNTKDGTVIQPYAHGHPDRERLALDISALKKQYSKLRERQRQAHIILQAACARQPMGQNSTSGPIAMNHLLLGKSAIVNSRGRRLGPPKGSIPPARSKEPVKKKDPVISGETIQWKDTEKFRRRQSCPEDTDSSQDTFIPDSDSSSYSEDDASSTSTELCDEPGRLSDFDSDDKNSVKDLKNTLILAEDSEVPIVVPETIIVEEFRELITEIEDLKCSDSDFKPSEIPEENFETFLEERVKILKEHSSDSLVSPKEETSSWRSEDKLRRHKSCEETSGSHLEKSVIFKQKSFDIGVLPIIETSLWKPYKIEEESPRDELEGLPSVDLLTVEDKRLEAGRRNSERALKIIQENSLILHRILQQQRSSEKEDSEDELSRSPISKTFLRSESLLSKDEKTDEDRSSKDGEEDLESGVESFSVSPALLDEESDRSKRDNFEDQEETLIISKNEDTEYSYKYQSSDNTSNIVSSSIFEDLHTDVSSIPGKVYEDYSPSIASNVLEDLSTYNNVDKYFKLEENEDSYSYKYSKKEEDTEEVLSFLSEKKDTEDSLSYKYSKKEEDTEEVLSFLPEKKDNEDSYSYKYSKDKDDTEEVLSFLSEKKDYLSFLKTPEESTPKEELSSFTYSKLESPEYSSKYRYLYKEDSADNITELKNEEPGSSTYFNSSFKHEGFHYKFPLDSPEYNLDIRSSLSKEDTGSSLQFSPEGRNKLSLELSPPKHLSCLQFSSFNTDLPCSSKSIQISPICSKHNSEISPTKTSPKTFSAFNLPTLSPPKRSLKSPISPKNSFSPFPVQPTTRQPKELGVKLGLYKDISPK